MPKREDIKSILIPGSGPIVIGQACEFDYSGVQACKALRKEGYRTILANSNPATIMTDMELAHATYIEPLTHDTLEEIIKKERPDALLPTVGGQTALNLAMKLYESGVLEKYSVELIGANAASIHRAESRREFKATMQQIGMATPASALCRSLEEGYAFLEGHGLPLVVRPSFTLGGTGGSIVYTDEEFERRLSAGFHSSPTGEVLLEESILGWKEFELEVMRDTADNVVIICSIENLDPMGVHTGDSITVAPQQTLSDRQYQEMRNAAIAIIRAIGVDTGGSNIQFAVNPEDGRMVAIEMNPRVSRSSALASKATGFPIARIAALLAVGYSLDELRNEITQVTPCSFEPTIDYVVVKVPRFSFEKFPGSSRALGTMMRSVGEAMGIGRTFKAALQKALRSLENGRAGFGSDGYLNDFSTLLPFADSSAAIGQYLRHRLEDSLKYPHPERIFAVKAALARQLQQRRAEQQGQQSKAEQQGQEQQGQKAIEKAASYVYGFSRIDPWFLYQFIDLILMEEEWIEAGCPLDAESLLCLKENGYSDRQLSFLMHRKKIIEHLQGELQDKHWLESISRRFSSVHNINPSLSLLPLTRDPILKLLAEGEEQIREKREQYALRPVYKRVDTCAGEFESYTPYLYSSFEEEDESQSKDSRYSKDSKDRMAGMDRAEGVEGAKGAEGRGEQRQVMIIGAGPNRIGQGIEFDYCCCHAAQALKQLGIGSIMVNCNPETVSTDFDTSDKLYFEPLSLEDVLHICQRERPEGVILSFGGQTPLLLAKGLAQNGVPIWGASPDMIDRVEDRNRSSELLKKLQLRQPPGGVALSITEAKEIADRLGYPLLVRPSYVLGGRAMDIAYNDDQLIQLEQAAAEASPGQPVLIDKFLKEAIELDVDALADGEDLFVAGIMQHIEEAGVHSGDSACVLPPLTVSPVLIEEIRQATRRIALELQVVGFINIQFAIQDETLYVLEINPRASRTVPFVSKAIGLPLARLATHVMSGRRLAQLQELQRWKEARRLPTENSRIVSVKEAVLPFSRFPGADIILGPEMKSTGEVMGIAASFGEAYIKALMGTGDLIPLEGGLFFSVSDRAKEQLREELLLLKEWGYLFYATEGSAAFLKECLKSRRPNANQPSGEESEIGILAKVSQSNQAGRDRSETGQAGRGQAETGEERRGQARRGQARRGEAERERTLLNPLEKIAEGKIQIIINIPYSERTWDDAFRIRQEGVERGILCITTVAGTKALVKGIEELRRRKLRQQTLEVRSLQSIHSPLQLPTATAPITPLKELP